EPEDWVEDDAPTRHLKVHVEEVDRHVPSVLAIELVEEAAKDDDDDDDKDADDAPVSESSDEGQVR
ncbi:MAG: hypothetical protein L0J93_10450, partial [Corynebacterium casei]|nr:hypothetical protein [Corynebacterium casei]MDN6361116.1 hypothetical protein [Corynebacterium casei]MDN6370924.1 hypothetical protein [Corynebacterium casei]